MRTALVLGAGGFVGQAFHLGVLTALAEHTGWDGRRADVLVGTSAGSLVAAGLAGDLSAADLAAELVGEPLSAEGRAVRRAARARPLHVVPDGPPLPGRRPLAPGAVLAAARRPWAVRPGAVVSSLLPAGRSSTDPIARGVRRLHGGSWPEKDLRVCAVRARDARRVVFGEPGAPAVDVGTAVAASCAIPGYFQPVRAHGEVYVDGGGHSPTNADVVLRDGPDLVLVLSSMTYGPGGLRRPRADLGMRVAVRRYLASEVRRLRRGGARVLVFEPSARDLEVMGLNPMRGLHVGDVVHAAAETVTARLRARPELAEVLTP